MIDRREAILNSEYNVSEMKKGIMSTFPVDFPLEYKDAAINAMDEYFTERAMELLEYMANNDIEFDTLTKGGSSEFLFKGKWISKEQLFQNFL